MRILCLIPGITTVGTTKIKSLNENKLQRRNKEEAKKYRTSHREHDNYITYR